MFIVFEGVDRVGKTTTIDYVANSLRELNYDVVIVSESNDPVMQIINQSDFPMEDIIPMIYNMRNKHQHLIKKFVDTESILLWDRYFDSTWVYGNDIIRKNEYWRSRIFDAIVPDLTIYLYGDMDLIHSRIGDENDRFTSGSDTKTTERHNLFVELYKSVISKRDILNIDVSNSCGEMGKKHIASLATSAIINKYVDQLAS